MLSVKTINNQNAITNAVLGLDGNSSTIVNGNLIVQDANNSFTITPTGTLPATNTTFNNIIVNGTETHNGLITNNNTTNFVSPGVLQILDPTASKGIQIFNAVGGFTTIQGIGANSGLTLNSRDATTQRNNIQIQNGNQITIQGTDGQGIGILNDQTTLGGLTPIITNGPVLGDNSNKIATTSFVQSSTTQFLRGYKFMTDPALPFATTPIGKLKINFTNGSTLKVNDSITIRFSIRYDYNNTSSTAQSIYYNSYYGNLIIFPNRVITNSESVPVYLSGSLNGQTSYTYNNATFAPSGRYIWTENYISTQAIDSLNNNPNPVIITSVLQSQLTLQFNLPYNTTGFPLSNCSLSVYLELINNNNSAITTITTTGSSFFDSVQKSF